MNHLPFQTARILQILIALSGALLVLGVLLGILHWPWPEFLDLRILTLVFHVFALLYFSLIGYFRKHVLFIPFLIGLGLAFIIAWQFFTFWEYAWLIRPGAIVALVSYLLFVFLKRKEVGHARLLKLLVLVIAVLPYLSPQTRMELFASMLLGLVKVTLIVQLAWNMRRRTHTWSIPVPEKVRARHQAFDQLEQGKSESEPKSSPKAWQWEDVIDMDYDGSEEDEF